MPDPTTSSPVDDPLGLFDEPAERPLSPAGQRLYDFLAPLDKLYGVPEGSMDATRRRYLPKMIFHRMHPLQAKLYYRGLIATDAACQGLQAEIDAARDLPPFDWESDPLPDQSTEQ